MKIVISILNSSIPLPAHFHIRIDNPPFMPLVIEGVGTGPRGLPAISVAHYGLQNGDAMRDPEICFEAEFKNGQIVELYPYHLEERLLGDRAIRRRAGRSRPDRQEALPRGSQGDLRSARIGDHVGQKSRRATVRLRVCSAAQGKEQLVHDTQRIGSPTDAQ
jgi:hypothetical protein